MSTIKCSIYFFLIIQLSISQEINVEGTISDINNNFLEKASIVLFDKEKKILTYTTSDYNGKYQIKYKIKEGYRLSINYLSFKETEYFFDKKDINNKKIVLNFKLNSEVNDLDEIILVALDNQVKDTVDVNIDKLNLQDDENLGDIIKLIPGFTLGSDNSIIYKGKSIDKILVNKKPAFKNQNSLAVNNLRKKIIDKIQVINNYMDDFSINFEDKEETVLNVDTKDEFKNIFMSDISSSFGYEKKYKLKGSGYYFSNKINAFINHNTNNIGKRYIDGRELSNLFTEGMRYSPYLKNNVRNIIVNEDNLTKDFYTSNNITLRNQNDKLKTSLVLYQIAPNKVKNLTQNIKTINNVSLINRKNEIASKNQSLFGNFFAGYKINSKSIIKYNLNCNYLDRDDYNETKNELFENANTTSFNDVSFEGKNYNRNILNDISVQSKLRKNIIVSGTAKHYYEKTFYESNYNILGESKPIKYFQKFNFYKNEFEGNIKLSHRISNKFIYHINNSIVNTEEFIHEENKIHTVYRKNKNYKLVFNASGNEIFKFIRYSLNAGISVFNIGLSTVAEKDIFFIPINVLLKYENKMNYFYMEFNNEMNLNRLNSGIRLIKPSNEILNGNPIFPITYLKTKHIEIGYSYVNLFEGKAFEFKISASRRKDRLRNNLIYQQYGVYQYNLFLVNNEDNYKIYSNYSKRFSMFKKILSKLDASIDYNEEKYPVIFLKDFVDVTNQTISPSIKLKTVDETLLNFSTSIKLSFLKSKTTKKTYKNIYSSIICSTLLKNKKWNGYIDFIYDNNLIDKNIYSRKNINMGLKYISKKITYSLEARHIGELLNIFNNNTYNSVFTIRNGFIDTQIYNKSLAYFVLGIEIPINL